MGRNFNDDLDASATSDVFTTPRYAELVESIMYAKPDYTFTVDGMDFNWCVLPVWKSDS
jgi:lipid A disaccharide synthetase